jgi:preprotein translocase YajC subunit
MTAPHPTDGPSDARRALACVARGLRRRLEGENVAGLAALPRAARVELPAAGAAVPAEEPAATAGVEPMAAEARAADAMREELGAIADAVVENVVATLGDTVTQEDAIANDAREIANHQNKKQKEAKKMLEGLRKGDRIVTIGGLRGTVVSVKDDAVILKVDDNTKLEYSKSAVATVLKREEETTTEPAKE